jgi:hypothetical protein
VVALLAEQLRAEVTVPPHPQEMGAFGAALAAREGAGSVGPDPFDITRALPLAGGRDGT